MEDRHMHIVLILFIYYNTVFVVDTKCTIHMLIAYALNFVGYFLNFGCGVCEFECVCVRFKLKINQAAKIVANQVEVDEEEEKEERIKTTEKKNIVSLSF